MSNFNIADGSLSAAPENAMVFEDVAIVVEHAAGEVCERCRRTDETVGKNEHEQLHMLCENCAQIVTTEFPEVLEEGFEI